MREPLDFDDAGADDSEPVKGVTAGDVRAWHDEMSALRGELVRVRKAHKAIRDEIIYGGGEFEEPNIDRIHDFSCVGLRDMIANKPAEVE